MDKKHLLRILKEEREKLSKLNAIVPNGITSFNLSLQESMCRIYGDGSNEHQRAINHRIIIVDQSPGAFTQSVQRFDREKLAMGQYLDTLISSVERFGVPKSKAPKHNFLSNATSLEIILGLVVILGAVGGAAYWGGIVMTKNSENEKGETIQVMRDSIDLLLSRPADKEADYQPHDQEDEGQDQKRPEVVSGDTAGTDTVPGP
jgi:hypothetical protein